MYERKKGDRGRERERQGEGGSNGGYVSVCIRKDKDDEIKGQKENGKGKRKRKRASGNEMMGGVMCGGMRRRMIDVDPLLHDRVLGTGAVDCGL